MANYRYFADIKGQAFSLTNIWHEGNNINGVPYFTGETDAGNRVAVTRAIEYKSMPSRHECDARCMNATGRIMKCECRCGGKNHGRGYC